MSFTTQASSPQMAFIFPVVEMRWTFHSLPMQNMGQTQANSASNANTQPNGPAGAFFGPASFVPFFPFFLNQSFAPQTSSNQVPINLADFLREAFNPSNQSHRQPTDAQVLKSLPRVEIFRQGEICSVCQDEFGMGSVALKLPCKHFFHDECIKPWLQDHNSCPNCRSSLPVEGSVPFNAAPPSPSDGTAPVASSTDGPVESSSSTHAHDVFTESSSVASDENSSNFSGTSDVGKSLD